MRLLPLSLLFWAASALAADVEYDEEEYPVLETTYFNGVAVPPLLDLTPQTWDQELNSSRWLMVKFFK